MDRFHFRSRFVKSHISWKGSTGEKKWRNIFWTDECKIYLLSNDYARTVRRPMGKEFHIRFTKMAVKHGGGNIMVYDEFSWYGGGAKLF